MGGGLGLGGVGKVQCFQGGVVHDAGWGNNPLGCQLLNGTQIDLIDSCLSWRSNILLDVCTVNKGQVDGASDVGGGEDEYVGVVLDQSQSGEH